MSKLEHFYGVVDELEELRSLDEDEDYSAHQAEVAQMAFNLLVEHRGAFEALGELTKARGKAEAKLAAVRDVCANLQQEASRVGSSLDADRWYRGAGQGKRNSAARVLAILDADESEVG